MARLPPIEKLCVTKDWTIKQVMECVNATACGIAIVVDADKRLVATVTDGDLRRAILQGLNLSLPIQELLSRKEAGPAKEPITAPASADHGKLLDTMRKYDIRQIPLLDAKKKVVGLARLEDLVDEPLPLQAVVMAGGFGKRLRPLTESTPKPLLPVGDRPLLERLVEQLRDSKIKHINISTHFLGEQIKEHLGDGRKWGVDINYLSEENPLGTAGSLSLLERPKEPVIIVNGDILTRLDFRAMLNFHRDNKATMTVAVKQYAVQIPYGVVETKGVDVLGLAEKPNAPFFVVAGIYLVNPEVWEIIAKGERCDMPDLIRRLIDKKEKVISFPISEYWLDIGKLEDYRNAQEDVSSGQF